MSDALDLHLTSEQRELYARTRALAEDELAPIAAAGDDGRVNRPLVQALAGHGLLPRLFDGSQVSAIELCLIREALARGCTEAETAFALQGLGAYRSSRRARRRCRRSGSPGSRPEPRWRRSR